MKRVYVIFYIRNREEFENWFTFNLAAARADTRERDAGIPKKHEKDERYLMRAYDIPVELEDVREPEALYKAAMAGEIEGFDPDEIVDGYDPRTDVLAAKEIRWAIDEGVEYAKTKESAGNYFENHASRRAQDKAFYLWADNPYADFTDPEFWVQINGAYPEDIVATICYDRIEKEEGEANE